LIETRHLLPRFITDLRTRVEEGTPGLPALHRQQLLRDLALPTSSDPLALRVASLLPLYLFVPYDLPRAGLRFRALYLRYQFRDVFAFRAPCPWCLDHDQEYGYHLLRCRGMPVALRALRDRALRLILADCGASDPLAGEANLRRLFCLSWRGSASWQPGRCDKGSQPSLAALQAALLFMRDAINACASFTAAPSPGRHQPIWRLPEHLPTEPPSDAELAAATPCVRPPAGAVRAPLDCLTSLPVPAADDAADDEYAGDWQASPPEPGPPDLAGVLAPGPPPPRSLPFPAAIALSADWRPAPSEPGLHPLDPPWV
jgi:hypothetical protein